MKYILSSAVITAEGNWSFQEITTQAAKKWLEENKWYSTIGYPDTADAASELFGMRIPCNKEVIQMKKGQEALVFRIIFPKEKGIPSRDKRGKFRREFVLENCQVGILRHLGVDRWSKDEKELKQEVIATFERLRPFLNKKGIEESYLTKSALDPSVLNQGWIKEDQMIDFYNDLLKEIIKYSR